MPASDRPDNDVIDNDAALDRWWENYLREQARKSGRRGDAQFALLGSPKEIGESAIPTFGGS